MSSQDYIARREYEKRQRQVIDGISGVERSIVELRGMIMETRSMVDHISKLTDQRFAAATEALRLALASMEKRLDQMNEFRAQLKDQSATFVTRELMDSMVAGMRTDIANVRKTMEAVQLAAGVAGGQAQGSKSTNTAWIAAVIAIATTASGIIVELVLRFIH